MDIKYTSLFSLLFVAGIIYPISEEYIKIAYDAGERFLDKQEHRRQQYERVYGQWIVALGEQHAGDTLTHGARKAMCRPLLQVSIQNPEILEGKPEEEFCDDVYNQVMEIVRKDFVKRMTT